LTLGFSFFISIIFSQIYFSFPLQFILVFLWPIVQNFQKKFAYGEEKINWFNLMIKGKKPERALKASEVSGQRNTSQN
jgi:uncharacterized membrane protein YjdF